MLLKKQIDKFNKIGLLYNTCNRKEAVRLTRKLSKLDLVGLVVYRCECNELLKQTPAQRVAFEDTVYQAIESL